MKTFNTYEEAYKYTLTKKWKIKTCQQGKNCWCRSITTAEQIRYLDPETEELEYLYIVRSGCLDAHVARYFVKLHNEKIGD